MALAACLLPPPTEAKLHQPIDPSQYHPLLYQFYSAKKQGIESFNDAAVIIGTRNDA